MERKTLTYGSIAVLAAAGTWTALAIAGDDGRDEAPAAARASAVEAPTFPVPASVRGLTEEIEVPPLAPRTWRKPALAGDAGGVGIRRAGAVAAPLVIDEPRSPEFPDLSLADDGLEAPPLRAVEPPYPAAWDRVRPPCTTVVLSGGR
ncbi:MAG: hypothetical protein ACOC83_06130 [Gemmatimonadota bacterium]